MTDVTIDGTTPEAIIDVSDSQKDESQLGEATIEVGATTSNRTNIESGDYVSIERGGETTFTGYVTGRPSEASDGVLRVKAMDDRLELKHEQTDRVFYDRDSGEALAEAVEYEAEGLSRRPAFIANHDEVWDTDAPILEPFTGGGSTDATIWEYGNDAVFVGFREGETGSYYIRNTGINQDSLVDGSRLLKAFTRILMNSDGDQFEAEFELRDGSGTSWVWDLELTNGFEEYELPAEDASPDGQLGGSWQAEYRITIKGSLSENRGMLIDAAHTVPFRRVSRNTDLTTGGVQSTGRTVTRRSTESVMTLLENFGQEDRFNSWVDENRVLHYEPAGKDRRPDLAIEEGVTPVTDASFDRNSERVRNVATVVGANDIKVTVRNSASIQFYGVCPRTDSIVDKGLQDKSAAETRGRGYLADNAWNDTVMSLEVADSDFKTARKGQIIPVVWPSEGISGDWVVRSKDIDKYDIPTVELGVKS